MENHLPPRNSEEPEEPDFASYTMNDVPPPPILKTWRRLYTAVLLALAAEIAIFYLFTRAFA